MSQFQCMATSIKPSTICFQSSQPCFGVKLSLMPAQICNSRSTFLFSAGKKQDREDSFLLRHLKIKALDVAQPFDYESKKSEYLEKNTLLKIGIVGFCNFGQFLAKTLVKQGHTVLAHSRSDHGETARKMGVSFFKDADDFCEEHPEVILLCSSIIATEAVLRSFPTQRLKRNILFVDVLSVKEFPCNLFLHVLPPEFDILCTHPMFGLRACEELFSSLLSRVVQVAVTRGNQVLRVLLLRLKALVLMTCAHAETWGNNQGAMFESVTKASCDIYSGISCKHPGEN